MISPVMTAILDVIVLETAGLFCRLWGPLALTPVQRWQAARKFSGSFWVVLVCVIALIIAAVLLSMVSSRRKRQERKTTDNLFAEYAAKRGLSQPECQMLLAVARRAGLKRNESIFTLATAFERGSSRLIEQGLSQQTPEVNERLKTELFLLREKLGFKKRNLPSIGSSIKSKKLSTRQIPVGKKLYLTRRRGRRGSGDIESTVVKNSNTELEVKLTTPTKVIFGEFWSGYYYFGASVWEFDTSVVSYDGDIMVLNHTDKVRFINRRRFLRVPTRRQGLIASFPFARKVIESSDVGEGQVGRNKDLEEPAPVTWGPPQFVPAVVTEFGGPGLTMESALKVKEGDRVLVVFNLDGLGDTSSRSQGRTDKPGTLKIVEDVGEVRRAQPTENGLLISVELTGLSDSNVDELIGATNAALLRANTRNSSNVLSAGRKQATEEPVGAHEAVQGAKDVGNDGTD